MNKHIFRKVLRVVPFLMTISSYSGFSQSQVKRSLITVASFGHYRPIGVAVAPEGNRVFISFPHGQPFRYALVELKDGKPVPFPDTSWNRFVSRTARHHFANVQDLTTDDQHNLWILDSSPGRGDQAADSGVFKLIRVNLATDSVQRIYYFDDLPKQKSALNDVNIDHEHGLAYLSDPGQHAIVVLNLSTGKTRVVLKDDPSTLAEPGFKLHLDGKDVVDGQGHPFVSNVNGIALTPDHRYLYYRAINQLKLYRIPTDALADVSLDKQALARKVEDMGKTGVSHGMIADKNGNVYLSASPEHAIRYRSPDGQVHTLISDPRIIWPDSFGIGSDGFLYFSCSQINRGPGFNGGVDKTDYPYRIYKVALP